MSSSDHGNQQNQKVGGSNYGQAGLAGHDLTQIQNTIRIGSPFFKDNLEEVSFRNRPWHFISVILFLLRIMLTWTVMGFQTKYKFPFKTLRSLFFATINGELVEYVSENQVKNSERIEKIVNGINREYISIDESITLELETEIGIKLIGFLSSSDLDKKEELAEFLGNLKLYYDSFTAQIEDQKRKQYHELYEWKKHQNEKTSGTKILNFINQLIVSNTSDPASDTFIYDLIDKVENYILRQKRGLSIQELSDFKQLKNFLVLISEKFITDKSEPSANLQFRHSALLKDFKNAAKKNKELENHNHRLEEDLEKALGKSTKEKDINDKLKDESIRLHNQNIGLIQKNEELENNIHKWQEYSKELESSSQILKQELTNSKNELRNKKQRIRNLQDPIFYLQECSRIKYISKKSNNKYHNNPECHNWRGLVLEYLIKTKRGDETNDFLVSQIYDYRIFNSKEKCSNCE